MPGSFGIWIHFIVYDILLYIYSLISTLICFIFFAYIRWFNFLDAIVWFQKSTLLGLWLLFAKLIEGLDARSAWVPPCWCMESASQIWTSLALVKVLKMLVHDGAIYVWCCLLVVMWPSVLVDSVAVLCRCHVRNGADLFLLSPLPDTSRLLYYTVDRLW